MIAGIDADRFIAGVIAITCVIGIVGSLAAAAISGLRHQTTRRTTTDQETQ